MDQKPERKLSKAATHPEEVRLERIRENLKLTPTERYEKFLANLEVAKQLRNANRVD